MSKPYGKAPMMLAEAARSSRPTGGATTPGIDDDARASALAARVRRTFGMTPHRRRAALAAAAVIALVWVSAIALRPLGPKINDPLDLAWFGLVQQIRFPALTSVSLVIDTVGKAPIDHVVVALAALGLLCSGRLRSGVLLMVAASVDGIQVQAVKAIADRLRPEHPLIATGNASYPSGHTAIAALVAVGIALALRKRWVWVCSASAVVLVAFSRTVLNVHWISDVVAGGALGGATMLLVWSLAPLALADRPGWRHDALDTQDQRLVASAGTAV